MGFREGDFLFLGATKGSLSSLSCVFRRAGLGGKNEMKKKIQAFARATRARDEALMPLPAGRGWGGIEPRRGWSHVIARKSTVGGDDEDDDDNDDDDDDNRGVPRVSLSVIP